jgi:hypothetical protein
VITFITRRNCDLCEERLPWLVAIASDRDIPVDVIDVDDEGLASLYGETVPVVMRDGEVILEGDFDEGELAEAFD